MEILEDNARRGKPVEEPLKVRCPYCDSLLLVEGKDCEKRYEWEHTCVGKSRKYYYYVTTCPCCKEEFRLKNNENI